MQQVDDKLSRFATAFEIHQDLLSTDLGAWRYVPTPPVETELSGPQFALTPSFLTEDQVMLFCDRLKNRFSENHPDLADGFLPRAQGPFSAFPRSHMLWVSQACVEGLEKKSARAGISDLFIEMMAMARRRHAFLARQSFELVGVTGLDWVPVSDVHAALGLRASLAADVPSASLVGGDDPAQAMRQLSEVLAPSGAWRFVFVPHRQGDSGAVFLMAHDDASLLESVERLTADPELPAAVFRALCGAGKAIDIPVAPICFLPDDESELPSRPRLSRRLVAVPLFGKTTGQNSPKSPLMGVVIPLRRPPSS